MFQPLIPPLSPGRGRGVRAAPALPGEGPPSRGHVCMFTPVLIVSVAAAWHWASINVSVEAGARVLAQGRAGARAEGSLRDVDHQVIVSIQGIVPAACIAEHLPRDCAQDRGGGHLRGRQGGQGCPHPSPRTPAGKGQRPSHRAVRGSHRHLQQGGRNTGRAVRKEWDLQEAVLGVGRGRGSFKGYWTQPGQPCWNQGPALPVATSVSN